MLLNLYPNENKFKLVTDITSRVSSSKEIRENVFLYEYYDVKDNETPEIIADKIYNDVNLHWVILLCNDIIDPVYDWVMSYEMLLAHAIKMYGEDNIYHTHHYEDENKNWVNSDYPNCRHVTNIEYLEQENEKKRSIKLLQPEYLSAFVDEVQTKLSAQID